MPRNLAHYEILEKIGAGGMGEVYRARDTKLDRDVAVKSIPETFAADSGYLARFEREAKVLAGLNHPGIGAIYGVEEAGDSKYLILELVEGEDLSERLLRGPIPLGETLEIALQVAEALEVAHEQGIVHRDLKPGNIKVTPDGKAKVLDFGLAKTKEHDSSSSMQVLHDSPTMPVSSPTASGIILGTAAYMSPEQARGSRVDKRSDIFAFGAVVMEMLTGQLTFPGTTVSDILAAVIRAEPPYHALPANTPPALRRLLERCLEKDPRRRLRDIGEARVVLEDLRSGAAQPEPVGSQKRPGFLRLYGGWLAALVVVVGAVAMAVLRPSAPQSGLPLRKSVIPMSAGDPSILFEYAPRLSPDGRYLVYASEGRLWLRDLSSVEPRPIPETESAAGPFWSPDGRWIAYQRGRSLLKVPREGGTPIVLATFPAGFTFGGGGAGDWGDDGRILMTSGGGGLVRVSPQGGEVTPLFGPAPGESDFHEVHELPGGKGLLLVVHDSTGYGNLDVVEPDGTRRRVLDVSGGVSWPAYDPSGYVVVERSGGTPGIWAFSFSLKTLKRIGEPFLVAAGGRAPSLSHEGSLVYVTGVHTREAQLVWLDRKGSVVGTVGDPVETRRPFPSLSPDEKSIVIALSYGDGRELYLFDVASGNRRRLTFNDAVEELAAWEPDGRSVRYYEGSDVTYQLPINGSGEPRRIAGGIMSDRAPDGSLVFARPEGEGFAFDIYMKPVGAEEDSATELIAAPGLTWWPKLSPDGEYLLYLSDETGQDEVYMTTFPRPTTRWQISSNGGSLPQWRRNGNEIFYTTHTALYAVSVDRTQGIRLGSPRKLFDRPSTNWATQWPDGFDVSADGQRFLMMQRVAEEYEEAQPRIVVVQNWAREFSEEPRP